MGARQLRRLAIPAAVIASLAVYAGSAGASPPPPNGDPCQPGVRDRGRERRNGRPGDVLGSTVVAGQLAVGPNRPRPMSLAPASFKGFADDSIQPRRSAPSSRRRRGIAPTRRQRPLPRPSASWSRIWSFRTDIRSPATSSARCLSRPTPATRAIPATRGPEQSDGYNRDVRRRRCQFLTPGPNDDRIGVNAQRERRESSLPAEAALASFSAGPATALGRVAISAAAER